MKKYIVPIDPWLLGATGTLLFGVGGAYLLWEGLDPAWPGHRAVPWRLPVIFVLSAGMFLASLLMAVFTVRTKMRPRVVLNHVRILIVEETRWSSARYADIQAARWYPRLKLGRLELVTASDRCRVKFSHFFLQPRKRQELIYLLRNCLPEEIQEGWEAFQKVHARCGTADEGHL